jgi:hypothetical protein
MALRLGTENKRQVYLLAALVVVILLIGGYELKQTFSSPAAPTRPAAAAVPAVAKPTASRAASPAASEGPQAQKLSNAGINPALHLDRLALTEDVAYRGAGRNIFAGATVMGGGALAHIPAPAKGPRPGPVVKLPPPPPPGPPRPPAIDLKYFGYAQARDKSLQAFFIHGDDIFIARTGEIVNHRYKVDAIYPGSVRVTDLNYNNTQSLPLTAN